jgi:hypothetical protein
LNHAESIAEQLELLFAYRLVGEHPGDAGHHRVAATALNAKELVSIEPHGTSIHWAGEQTDDPGVQRGRGGS